MQSILRQLTQTERSRLFRYASWVRRITGFVTEDLVCFFHVLFGLSSNNPFQNLRELHGWMQPALLPFLHRFVSPHLTGFSLSVATDDSLGCSGYRSLTDAILAIPGPYLQRFSLGEYKWENSSCRFKQQVSATVLQCGPALKYLAAGVELSEAAVLHVIQLPHLLTLKLTHEPPPDITNIISLQDTIVLPSLGSLTLASSTSYAWLPFLNDLLWRHPAAIAVREPGQSQVQIGIHSALKELYCWCGEVPKWSIVRQALAFKNLTVLEVRRTCQIDGCSFDLTDDNVTAITKALPWIQRLCLGGPCHLNTCQTTFRALLALSANCVELEELDIHFNTINIIEDVRSLLETDDLDIQRLRKGRRCRVTSIPVSRAPLTVDELATEVLAQGLLFVFPALEDVPVHSAAEGATRSAWLGVGAAISRLKGLRNPDP